MDHKLVSIVLALLLSLSQAHHLMNPGGEDDDSLLHSMDMKDSDPDDVDITTRILQSNNGSSEILMEGDLAVPMTRNAEKCQREHCLWKKSRYGFVIVPFVLSNKFDNWQRTMIKNAMKTFHKETCIRFVPRSYQKDYISIEDAHGCFSYIGRNGGKQVVGLAKKGCIYQGVIQHELNHALGFNHEHTRSDRDQHISINWDNIAPGSVLNFHKVDTNNMNIPYDYTSVMHYGRTAFSVNGELTMIPLPDPNQPIGQSITLSAADILRINKLYRCCE